MTETTFSTAPTDANISAYENIDTSQLNTITDTKPTEEKLEKFLVKVVFFAKVFAWVGITTLILSSLYGWTKNQSQDAWLMNIAASKAGTPLCTWMNGGNDAQLRRDTAFRDYLTVAGKQSLTEFVDSGRCMAPETIATWLEMEKNFASDELKKVYEKVIPKKFIGSTITSSAELDVIAENSPTHRMQHDEILQVLSQNTEKFTEGNTKITCQEVRFRELTAEANCTVTTRSPIQPRAKAIEFMKSISNSASILVTYPNTLDMKIDEKTNALTTEFSVQMTYIPSRYEADQIQKLTYDKR